jgi:putative acetyltransferase
VTLEHLKGLEGEDAVAREVAGGSAIGCGALVLNTDHAELKRMYTHPSHRGQGVASELLQLLESEARTRGCARFMPETGYLQPEALALYERHGYERCGPFGDYADDPNSVFMRKVA